MITIAVIQPYISIFYVYPVSVPLSVPLSLYIFALSAIAISAIAISTIAISTTALLPIVVYLCHQRHIYVFYNRIEISGKNRSSIISWIIALDSDYG